MKKVYCPKLRDLFCCPKLRNCVLAGGLTMLMGCVFLVLYCVGPPPGFTWHTPKKTSLREVLSPGSCAGGRPVLGSLMVLLLVLYYVSAVAMYMGMWTLDFTYAVESHLGFDKQEAALMDFTTKLCLLLGRALVILVSGWVPASAPLFSASLGGALSLVFIVAIGLSSKAFFWSGLCVYWFLSAGAFGAGYAFADKYIVLYACVVTLTSWGIGLGGFGSQALYGYLYQHTAPHAYFYVSLAMAGVCVALAAAMQLVANRLGNRFDREAREGTEEGGTAEGERKEE